MGLRITTDDKPVTVIRKYGTSKAGKAYTMYSLMYSFKNSSNEWKNVFVDCQFRKGVDLANKTKINITNAFMTGMIVTKNMKKEIVPKIFVLDYEVAEQGEQPQSSSDMPWMNIPDNTDELPFQ